MKKLIETTVKRPVALVMTLSALVLAGIFSVSVLPVQRLPDFSIPRITVETKYSGMGAEDIRSTVTIPVEDALSSVKGLRRQRSVSREGSSLVVLDFDWGIDSGAASVLVREAIDAVYPELPEGTEKPAVIPGDFGEDAHIIVAVNSRHGSIFARDLAEYEIRARLRRIEGAGAVIITGGETPELEIRTDLPKAVSRGLFPADIAGILSSETVNIPAGNAREGEKEIVVTSSGRPESEEELLRIVLPSERGPFGISDVGIIRNGPARKKSLFISAGKKGLSEAKETREQTALEIYRKPLADPIKLSREIRKTVNEAAALFGKDAEITIIFDDTPAIAGGLWKLLFSACLGIGAVMAVLFVTLRRFRYSILAGLSIPLSACASLAALALFGRSLNSMSVSGIALGIGLVSDTSVILLDLLESEFGRMKTRPSPEAVGKTAASAAASGLGGTLTTVIVFLPVVFLPGPLGALFGDLSTALVFSIGAGWAYAQFALPCLYRLIFSPVEKCPWTGFRQDAGLLSVNKKKCRNTGSEKTMTLDLSFYPAAHQELKLFTNHAISQVKTLLNSIFGGISSKTKDFWTSLFSKTGTAGSTCFFLRAWYSKLFRRVLRNPFPLFVCAAVLSAAGIMFLFGRPAVFISVDDAQEIEISLDFPPGTSLEAMVSVVKELAEKVSALHGTGAVFGRAGAEDDDSGRRASPDYRGESFRMRCMLLPGFDPEKMLAAAEDLIGSGEFKKKSGVEYIAAFPADRTEKLLGLSSSATLAIKGKDLDEARRNLAAAETYITKSDYVWEYSAQPRGMRDEIRIRLDREASAFLGISAAETARAVYAALEGIAAVELEIDGRPLPVKVTGGLENTVSGGREGMRNMISPAELASVPVALAKNGPVFLGSMASMERREVPSVLLRLDRSDVLYLDILPKPGKKAKLYKFLNGLYGKGGVKGLSRADDSVFIKYRNSLILTLALVIMLLYLSIGALFESFSLPLIFMLTIPFSLAGAGPALFFSGSALDSQAALGLMVLFGLSVNSGMVLFERAEEKVFHGLSPEMAVYGAARERLYPVLATTLTTIFALLPMAFSPLGRGQRSMAAAMLGGICVSAMISLFALPPVFIRYLKAHERKQS
jgi:multidrug efflux pump subunit AcrB